MHLIRVGPGRVFYHHEIFSHAVVHVAFLLNRLTPKQRTVRRDFLRKVRLLCRPRFGRKLKPMSRPLA